MRIWSMGITLVLIAAHQAVAEKTFIVKDGKPMAEIVVAEQPARMAKLAAEELRAQLKKMSGAELPIVAKPTDANPVKVYVGKSALTDKLGVTDEGLSHGAFRIKSGPNYLILLGKDVDFKPTPPIPTSRGQFPEMLKKWDELSNSTFLNPTTLWYKHHNKATGLWLDDEGGTFNAVNAFLRSLGCRWYMPGPIGEVIPERKTIPLPSIDETIHPDYVGRVLDWGNYARYTWDEVMWGRRLGLNNNAMGGPHGLAKVHGRKKMQAAHPEYYALHGGKRDTTYRGTGHACLSSEGLFQEAVRFARACYDVLDFPAAPIMPQDGYHHCQCPRCAGKSPSELVWSFVDRVAKDVHKTHPDRLVIGGAYTAYRDPPKSIDKFSPNVAVRISWHRTGFDNPENWKSYWDLVQAWNAKLAPGRLVRNANNFLNSKQPVVFPIIFPHGVAKDLKALNGMSLGERSGLSRNPGDYWLNPGANHLNIYALSQYLWDADQNLDALLDEYYETFYGPAAKEMKTAFEFAEASYPRDGRANPSRVPMADRVRYLELLHAARKAAGDGIHGDRVQLIIDEMDPIEVVRQKMKLTQARGEVPEFQWMHDMDGNDKWREAAKTFKLDGNLDEPFWTAYHHAASLAESRTGRAPAFGANFLLKWKDALHVGIRCEEPAGSELNVTTTKNDDPALLGGDYVTILLETNYGERHEIAVNPSGAVFDRNLADEDARWDSQAEVATRVGDGFWTAEIRIPVIKESVDPLHTVIGRAPSRSFPWYFNVCRQRARGENKSCSAYSPTGSDDLRDPLKFGKLYTRHSN